ncbi:MAG: DNA polymerase III subunit alpha, partial [Enterovibrio sp.]
MADPRFIHLRTHSEFSMVDGLSKVSALVKKVAEFGMPALALTDFTNLCGLVKFYETTQRVGVKPIIGADFLLQSPHFGDELCQLTLLAANNQGYKNLTLLISRAYLRGHVQHRPVLDHEWLSEFSEGLIVLSGARNGELGKALLKGNQSAAQAIADFYKQCFPDNFYIELIRTGRADEESYLQYALEFAVAQDLPVVATNEVCFLTLQLFEPHEIRVAIHDGYTLEDPRRPKNYSAQQFLRSEQEMCELFADLPQALQNSVEIAKRCNVTLRLGEYFLPNFPTDGLEVGEFLVKKSKEGLEKRLAFLFPDPAILAQRRGEYEQRLDIELTVINQMGFPGYFLIVMEFIQWSKDNGIPVGPGRGSGAGSLVAYALQITDLDPLEFDLLFERFLNPERVSMPDFDIDFCMDKRDRVIEHVAQMYGRDAVSQIITFGTMAAKAVIRDVGRVLGHPYGFVDRISKLIPPDPGMTLAKAFDAEPAL